MDSRYGGWGVDIAHRKNAGVIGTDFLQIPARTGECPFGAGKRLIWRKRGKG